MVWFAGAAEAEGEALDPALERRLKRAALKVRRILKVSQEPMSLETPVGLYTQRSPAFIVGALAILKAGGII